MNKMIGLFVLVAIAALAGAKPQPKPDLLAYSIDGVPVVAATAPAAVASYATVYEHTVHGNLAPASYVAYTTYDPYHAPLAAVPVGASILLRK
ncbi:uncharacterized protein LOC118467098 [Anopheles albimanus]|uniref:Uncharacterized protein n=1 Tax=Anopheles albimanus TaxID=7167 RepID=A0A182FH15_ANOAL|nr:uncharacterized protein LOC118467098 [Anopheles albimanus]